VVASISRTVSSPPSLINADFVLDLVPCPSMEKDVRAAVIRLDEAEAAIGTNCVTTGSARSSASTDIAHWQSTPRCRDRRGKQDDRSQGKQHLP